MMRSKMLDRAEERGEKRGLELGEKLGEHRGRSSCAAMVRLYMEGNDISKVARETGKDEKVVREFLTEAGMLPQ